MLGSTLPTEMKEGERKQESALRSSKVTGAARKVAKFQQGNVLCTQPAAAVGEPWAPTCCPHRLRRPAAVAMSIWLAFETGSHVAQAGFELPMQRSMTLS